MSYLPWLIYSTVSGWNRLLPTLKNCMERNVKNVANSLSFFFAEKLKKINKNKVRIFFASVLTKKKGNAENENPILWSKVAIDYSNSKFLIFKFLFWNILKRFRNSNMYYII